MVLVDEPVISALQAANGAREREASVVGVSNVWPQIATINSKIPKGRSGLALFHTPIGTSSQDQKMIRPSTLHSPSTDNDWALE